MKSRWLRSGHQTDLRDDLARCEREYASLGRKEPQIADAIDAARAAVTDYYDQRGNGAEARRLVSTAESLLTDAGVRPMTLGELRAERGPARALPQRATARPVASTAPVLDDTFSARLSRALRRQLQYVALAYGRAELRGSGDDLAFVRGMLDNAKNPGRARPVMPAFMKTLDLSAKEVEELHREVQQIERVRAAKAAGGA